MTEIETVSERGNTSRGSGRGIRRLIAEEPDVGLDPITPGSRPADHALMSASERGNTSRGSGRENPEADSPLSTEPHMGLDPRTPRS